MKEPREEWLTVAPLIKKTLATVAACSEARHRLLVFGNVRSRNPFITYAAYSDAAGDYAFVTFNDEFGISNLEGRQIRSYFQFCDAHKPEYPEEKILFDEMLREAGLDGDQTEAITAVESMN